MIGQAPSSNQSHLRSLVNVSKIDLLPEEPVSLPMLPLRDVVVFPHMVIPLFVGRPKSIKAMEIAMEAGKHIFWRHKKCRPR